MTHPSDFYCVKGLITSCRCHWIKAFYLHLANPFTYETMCQMLWPILFFGKNYRYEESGSGVRGLNRPKLIPLIKDDLNYDFLGPTLTNIVFRLVRYSSIDCGCLCFPLPSL